MGGGEEARPRLLVWVMEQKVVPEFQALLLPTVEAGPILLLLISCFSLLSDSPRLAWASELIQKSKLNHEVQESHCGWVAVKETSGYCPGDQGKKGGEASLGGQEERPAVPLSPGFVDDAATAGPEPTPRLWLHGPAHVWVRGPCPTRDGEGRPTGCTLTHSRLAATPVLVPIHPPPSAQTQWGQRATTWPQFCP